jgi:hypothetical protein
MLKPRIAFAVLLLAASAALPQKPVSPPPPPDGVDQGLFFETVSVNVVNVDVFVTDKAGNRVRGLTKDDFELYEDRKPVQISNF